MPTPCEKLDYKVGQAFHLLTDESSDFNAGDIIYLHEDDKTEQPYFRDTEEYDEDETYIECFYLHQVVPYTPGKTPVQSLGYKPGDLFIAGEDSGFGEGTIITLTGDDGSVCPHFETLDGNVGDYPYLSQVKPLEVKVGRKARIRVNRTCGHVEGTEGVITDLSCDTVVVVSRGAQMCHPISDVVTFAFGDDEEVKSTTSRDWDVIPHTAWVNGQVAIIRTKDGNPHSFDLYEVVTYTKPSTERQAYFTNSTGKVQIVDLDTVERIPKPGRANEVEFMVTSSSSAVPIIKAIRKLTGWGLKESKDAFDEAKASGRWKTLGVFSETDAWVFYAMVIDAKGDVSLDTTDDPLSPAQPVSSPATWPTKPSHEWKKGDKGIIRGQNPYDEHHFTIGGEVTFVEGATAERGRFEGSSHHRSQTVDYELVEPIQSGLISYATLADAAKQILGDDMASSKPKQVMYYQDGDSKEMTLIGYFQSKPVLGYIDRWDDPQVFIGKESLMTEID